jgi:hypothetical protein
MYDLEIQVEELKLDASYAKASPDITRYNFKIPATKIAEHKRTIVGLRTQVKELEARVTPSPPRSHQSVQTEKADL